jgi:hypothetical protein
MVSGMSAIRNGVKQGNAFFTFAQCMLLDLLYLKPTLALILKYTFTSTFIKTLKLVKNVL